MAIPFRYSEAVKINAHLPLWICRTPFWQESNAALNKIWELHAASTAHNICPRSYLCPPVVRLLISLPVWAVSRSFAIHEIRLSSQSTCSTSRKFAVNRSKATDWRPACNSWLKEACSLSTGALLLHARFRNCATVMNHSKCVQMKRFNATLLSGAWRAELVVFGVHPTGPILTLVCCHQSGVQQFCNSLVPKNV